MSATMRSMTGLERDTVGIVKRWHVLDRRTYGRSPLRFGGPDYSIAASIPTSEVGRFRVALRQSVIPRPTAALRARWLVKGERTCCTLRHVGHDSRNVTSALAGAVLTNGGLTRPVPPAVPTGVDHSRIFQRL